MEDNQIICGEATDILSSWPEQCIDAVITDPPYLCNCRDRDGRQVRNDNDPGAVLSVYSGLYRVLKWDSYCITFYGWNAIDQFSSAWTEAGFRSVGQIVWVKDYASGSGHTCYRHEAAMVLAKGSPKYPENPIADIQPWTYTGNRNVQFTRNLRQLEFIV